MTVALAVPIRELDPKDLYRASARGPEVVQVPDLTFIMIDGHGDPNTSTDYKNAIEALYGLSYTLKFALKKELGLVYRVGALEGLWWADDMAAFTTERKADYHWTAMIAQSDAVTPEWFARASDGLGRRKPVAALGAAHLERFAEGLCAQVLYVGPYSAE
ncbi:MAG TPA: GyrI-like domain-containing protein, partial [Candidatus Limnocylindrales bacterium]